MPKPQAVVPSRSRQHPTARPHYEQNIGDLLCPTDPQYLGQVPRADTSVQDVFHPRSTQGTFSSISGISPGVSMHTPQHDGSATFSGMASPSSTESGYLRQYYAGDGSQNIETVQDHAVDSFLPINQASPYVDLQPHGNGLQIPVVATDAARFGHGQHQGTHSWLRTQPTGRSYPGTNSQHGGYSTRENFTQAQTTSRLLYSQENYAADHFMNEGPQMVPKGLENYATHQQYKGLGNLASAPTQAVPESSSPKMHSPEPWTPMKISLAIAPSTFPCIPCIPNPVMPIQPSTRPYIHYPDDTIEPRPGNDPVGPPRGYPRNAYPQ